MPLDLKCHFKQHKLVTIARLILMYRILRTISVLVLSYHKLVPGKTSVVIYKTTTVSAFSAHLPNYATLTQHRDIQIASA